MSESRSRRRWIQAGVAAVTGGAGIAVAARIAAQYGLVPPDCGGLYGPGHTLTYGAHRLLTSHSMAREFSRSQISEKPFAKGRTPKDEVFLRMQAGGFKDWRLAIDGLVSAPASFSLADIRSYPVSGQITQLICEEGWSYVAAWAGVPLSHILRLAGMKPEARYIVYRSYDKRLNAIDMADALHPQTLVTYAMNDGDLPVGHGGPLRLRVPRQLGYKNVKFLTGITAVATLDGLPMGGKYSWYAGI